MKKIGIYSSINVGEVKNKNIDYIAVDNGVSHLIHQNIKPIFVIGDLDSLEDDKLIEDYDIKIYPSIKDDTATALAIQEAINLGYTSIDLYGVTHKRLDHFMAVLCLLRKYSHINITIYDEYNKIYLLRKGQHIIKKDNYKYFSLFAYVPTMITLQECHYPLNNYLLEPIYPLCVSNQMNNDHSIITTSEDILFIQST